MFRFRSLGLSVALGALIALSVVSLPYTGDLIAPGAVQALEGSDPQITVPATDEEPIGTPDAFPVAVVDPLEVESLPATGEGLNVGAGGAAWFDVLVLLAVIAGIGAIALAATVYGYNRAEREKERSNGGVG
jgi:hypothetical protein